MFLHTIWRNEKADKSDGHGARARQEFTYALRGWLAARQTAGLPLPERIVESPVNPAFPDRAANRPHPPSSLSIHRTA